jgi:hypothetical protein
LSLGQISGAASPSKRQRKWYYRNIFHLSSISSMEAINPLMAFLSPKQTYADCRGLSACGKEECVVAYCGGLSLVVECN